MVVEEGKDAGGSCLQRALRTEVPSAAANTVLTLSDWAPGNPRPKPTVVPSLETGARTCGASY